MSQQYQRIRLKGANCELSALEYPNPGKPDLVILHGMRDHSLSMGSIVDEFSPDYRILVPDLRGHGDSENPGSYTMVQFIADLRALVKHCKVRSPVLVGHSLGGHIASKYAAIYPFEVKQLVLIDGMGPPRPPVEPTRESLRAGWQMTIDSALVISSERRSMQDEAEALGRLRRNNPKLSAETARLIVHEGIEAHPDGGVCWKWDPAVNMVWSTFEHRDSELQWSLVECPVLIVTGDESMNYWTAQGIAPEATLQMHAKETERRRQLFANAVHVEIPGAGHMIHYDQPGALNQCLRTFLGS